jgi:hypothetical protein
MAMVTHHRRFWNRVQHRLETHPLAYLTGFLVCCVVAFLITIPLPRVDGQLIGSDGIYYYSYLPTLLIDHDLSSTSQYAKLMVEKAGGSGGIAKPVRNTNKHAIGSAILWMPFFLIGHLLAILFNAAGYPIALDGTGYIYQAPVMIGSILYGFAGVLLVYRSCSRFFSRWGSVSAAILIWLATNVIYYMIAEPSMSHACSFFATALFLDAWLRYRPLPSSRQWILIGMAGGLVALVRLQDVTWLALPLLDASWAVRTDIKKHLRRQWKGFLFFSAAAFVVFMPQIAIWLTSEGAQRYHVISTGRFHWAAPEISNVLFSFRHGLYLWHPVLLFATGGLVLLYRRNRLLTLLLALMLAAQLYLIGAWYAWWGGHSFGSRMLISSFPALALGLAALLDWSAKRNALPMAGILACSLILWNALFFAQYRLGYISKYSAITLNQLTLGKFSMLLDIAHRIQTMMR